MNYGNAIAGDVRSSPKAADRPRLSMQLEQLAKVLAECHHNAGNIEQAADRILGPVPQNVEKQVCTPPSDTIERRLAELIGVAEGLNGRLQDANNRLGTAV